MESAITFQRLGFYPAIPATIDIDEPIVVSEDISTITAFRYTVGDPVANAFALHFYLTMQDAESEVNAWTAIEDVLTYEMTPRFPVEADAEEEQYGELKIVRFQEIPYEVAYGRISICQPLSLLGDPKQQEVGPQNQTRRRMIRPRWEDF